VHSLRQMAKTHDIYPMQDEFGEIGKPRRPGPQTNPAIMLRQDEASSEKKKKRSGVPKSRHGCRTCKYA
jgi:hypothetical protein